MAVEDFEQALVLLSMYPSAEPDDWHGPVPPDWIEAGERALGRKFPRSYRRFLETLGCGGIGGLEFYGIPSPDFDITPGRALVPSAVAVTLADRQRFKLPDHYLVIFSVGEGTMFALDFDDWILDECPVVSWYLRPTEPKWEYSDFGDFFLAEIERVLERKGVLVR
jgi:hypothetical protein